MTETEVYNEKGEVVNLRAQWFKAVARLRTLITVNQREVHLFTTPDGERWLSDRYVVVKVTDDPALQLHCVVCPDCGVFKDAPDGMYKLTAGKGLQSNENAFQSDTAALLGNFQAIPDGEWCPVTRTQWSVADSPHKLMLAYITPQPKHEEDVWRQPVAINEGIWNAMNAAYPEATFFEFQYVPDGKHNVFRVQADGQTVAYVAGGTVPPERKGEALVLVGVVD